MPIGVPRIIYCWGEELPAQWTDIYNFIFRRRMVFLMQYLDDELCNQICGLLINIHLEDRSKEMEKKEMESSGLFKNPAMTKKENLTKNLDTSAFSKSSMGSWASPAGKANRKEKSIEDLIISEEDLAIDENHMLERHTLQKISLEWLNWNAQFFDYSDEPYLFYLAELFAKDFSNSENQLSFKPSSPTPYGVPALPRLCQPLELAEGEGSEGERRGPLSESPRAEIPKILSMFQNMTHSSAFGKDSKNQGESFSLKKAGGLNVETGSNSAFDVYSAFRLLTNFTAQNYKDFKFNPEMKNPLTSLLSKETNFSLVMEQMAQKILVEKLSTKEGQWNSSEKALTQRQLRKNYSQERSYSKNRSFAFSGSETQGPLGRRPKANPASYLNDSTDEAYMEYRDYYRKQTERTFQDEEAKKVFVIINSFGGSVGNGITVHDALQFIKAGSMTLALGVAASAASLVLAGGTIGERYVTEGCHTMIHQPECLTPDHEVLTSEGWLPIPQVTVDHKVATRSSGGEIVYQHPTKIHTYDYKGDLYQVKTQGIDLLVTPEHRMFVNSSPYAKVPVLRLEEAKNLIGKKARYFKTGRWEAPDYQFIMPAVSNNSTNQAIDPKRFAEYAPPMDAWLTFFGLWVAEGWAMSASPSRNDYRVIISQKKQSVRNIIEESVNNLGINASYAEDASIDKNFTIYSKRLWTYLYPLSTGARLKYLPEWVWKLSSRQCNVLLDGLLAGDGHVNRNDGTRHYFTSSKRLALDVARLIFHSGTAATVGLETAPSREYREIHGRPIEAYNPFWRVNVLLSRVNPYVNYGGLFPDGTPRPQNDAFIPYEGPVHCLTVPNSVFYVQRNGIPIWTGNSGISGQASDIWIDSQEIMKIRLDVAEIYSLSTYRPRHKILRDLDRDFYLTATETIYYGLADEIATNEVMHEIIEMTSKVWDYHDSVQQRLLESRESANDNSVTQVQN
jgi:ATP-dependent protease ClpP protease subunit